ncbi:hypothetical protein NLX62_07840, partial [Mycobacteriaceae bacterium Msp059]|nr:hypothetical protein [Mycobacteriaceae bacterium Msp059]
MKADNASPRQRLRLSLPKPLSEAVDGIETRTRTALADLADRTPNLKTAQSLPRPKSTTKRAAREIPETVDTTAAEKAAPDIADAIDAITDPGDAK